MNIPIMLAAAELGGSIHVGLAALGAAVGIGLIGQGASEAVGRNPGAATKILVQAMLSTAFAESIVFSRFSAPQQVTAFDAGSLVTE